VKFVSLCPVCGDRYATSEVGVDVPPSWVKVAVNGREELVPAEKVADVYLKQGNPLCKKCTPKIEKPKRAV
jgi:hypothetical protein